MLIDLILLLLRICLISIVWFVAWKYIEPKTQLTRILRAAVLVLSLLVILAMIRITGE
ncbi:MAG: hypothetical protein P8016_07210 [Sedimentisphaerales bacterium]